MIPNVALPTALATCDVFCSAVRDVLGSHVDEKHHGDGLNVPRSCYVGGAEGQGNYVRPFEEGCPPLADTSLASASVDAAFADKYAERFGFSVPVATLMATEGSTAELVAFALLKDFDDKVASGSCTAALHLSSHFFSPSQLREFQSAHTLTPRDSYLRRRR